MKPLVLIHGIILSGWVFTRMEKFFTAKGYRCVRFDYPSRTVSIEDNSKRLKQWLSDNSLEQPDFICHSMGGLVCHQYFMGMAVNQPVTSKVICLGSPFHGSMVARSLSQSSPGRKLIGVQSDSGLTAGVESWPGEKVNLGVIAGNKNFGAGRLLGIDSSKAGDGTVLVEETRIQGMTDHVILPVSHSQMTFSKRVFKEIEHFLNHSKFSENSP